MHVYLMCMACTVCMVCMRCSWCACGVHGVHAVFVVCMHILTGRSCSSRRCTSCGLSRASPDPYPWACCHKPTPPSTGYIFGCYSPDSWHVAPRFYGSGETFLFQLEVGAFRRAPPPPPRPIH